MLEITLQVLVDVGDNGYEYADFSDFDALGTAQKKPFFDNQAGTIILRTAEARFQLEKEDLRYFFKHVLANLEKIERDEPWMLSLWLSEMSKLRFYPSAAGLRLEEWRLQYDPARQSSKDMLHQTIEVNKSDFIQQIALSFEQFNQFGKRVNAPAWNESPFP